MHETLFKEYLLQFIAIFAPIFVPNVAVARKPAYIFSLVLIG